MSKHEAALKIENDDLRSQLQQSLRIIENRDDQIEYLSEQLRRLKRQMFSSKSERVADWSDEQLQFNEIEGLAAESGKSDTAKEEINSTRKKPGKQSKPLSDDLPIEEVVIDLPESEKVCSEHGCELEQIGFTETKKLKTVPAKIWVVNEKRPKYCCPECDESPIKQAKSQSILPGTIATAELLAFIVFAKFFQGLPLYRLEELFKLNGVDLSRGRMASWLITLSQKLIPIQNLLIEKMQESGYMQIDQTRVQVLKEPGRKATSPSAMWCRGSPEKNIVIFHYNPSQSGYVAKELTEGFSGTLQSDAHKAFDQVDVNLQLGCMMHVRRKFYDALKGPKKGQGRAKTAIQMIKQIYEWEALFKEQNLTPEDRANARGLKVVPLYRELKSFCEKNDGKVPPSTDLAKAIKYTLGQYDRLEACLKDGRYEIDNGWCERAIRKFAIGRNNWLFSDSVDGAEASALFYSLAITAKLNGINPYDALVDVFKALPAAETIDDFEKLAGKLTS